MFYWDSEKVFRGKNIKRKSDAPSVPQIRSIIMKFGLTGCINEEHKVHSPRASQEKRKNTDTALQKMKAEATIPSIRKLNAASSSSIGTVHRYLRRELKLFPYKVTIGQSLSNNHKTNRYAFCKRMMSKISKDTTWIFIPTQRLDEQAKHPILGKEKVPWYGWVLRIRTKCQRMDWDFVFFSHWTIFLWS